MPKISIILTNYKQPEFTKLCIESLNNASFKDKEIILMDNTHNNIGLAASSNKGAKQAKGEYLFFLNNDTLVKRDIFERLLESEYAVSGCRMFDYSGERELASGISLDRFGCPAGDTGKVFYPDGAIFIKRKIFEEIGGFDEKLFLYGEDRDLCWRVWLAGYNIGICFDAVFYHNSSCVDNTNYYRRQISERNIIYSMLKNYSAISLLKIIPQYIFWSILELGYILFTKPQALWKSYFPAYWWVIKNLKGVLRKRKQVLRRIDDRYIPFSKVIGKLYVLKKGVLKWGRKRYL